MANKIQRRRIFKFNPNSSDKVDDDDHNYDENNADSVQMVLQLTGNVVQD